MNKKFLILLISFFIISCQSDNKEEEMPTELKDLKSIITIEKIWSKKVLSDFPIGEINIVFNQENIFLFSKEGDVSALNLLGKEVWTNNFDEQISSGLGYGFKSIFFASENGKIVSLDAESGNKLWESNVNGEVLSSPSTNGVIVAVQTSNGKITALDFDDGSFKWEYQSTVSPLSLRGTSKPVFDKGFVFIGFGNGNLAKIESRSGVVQWEVPVTVSQGVSEIERMIDIDADPVIARNGLAYAVTYQGDLSAIDIDQGRTLWRNPTSSTKNIIHTKNITYIIDSSDIIKSYDGINGNILWILEDLKLRQLSSPKKYKNYLISGDYEGYLHLIDLNTGLIEGRTRPSRQAVKEVFVHKDIFFSLDDSGRISALKFK
jgi:outer membrane protein assembly factor BamB